MNVVCKNMCLIHRKTTCSFATAPYSIFLYVCISETNDAVCLFCIQLMIPGKDTCPDGWVKEYTGYIVGSAHSHKHSGSYICVDDTPHVVPGSSGDQAGELLHMVETVCPSLQCEPYAHGRELRCVVCSI